MLFSNQSNIEMVKCGCWHKTQTDIIPKSNYRDMQLKNKVCNRQLVCNSWNLTIQNWASFEIIKEPKKKKIFQLFLNSRPLISIFLQCALFNVSSEKVRPISFFPWNMWSVTKKCLWKVNSLLLPFLLLLLFLFSYPSIHINRFSLTFLCLLSSGTFDAFFCSLRCSQVNEIFSGKYPESALWNKNVSD